MSFKSLFQAYEDLEFGNKVSFREFIHHLENCSFNSSIKRSFCDDPGNFANLFLKSIKRFSEFESSYEDRVKSTARLTLATAGL